MLGVYYFLSLTVCASVCLSRTNFKLILLFCFSMESSHFWPSVLHDPLYKTLFLDFWFRPLTPKIYSPKFAKKSTISQLVWQIDRKYLYLSGGYRRRPIQWNHTKCCGADRCCHDNEIRARRGDLIAYRLVSINCLHFCSTVLTVKGHIAVNRYSHLTALGRHLPHGITQCYLPPDTSERASP